MTTRLRGERRRTVREGSWRMLGMGVGGLSFFIEGGKF